MPTSAKPPQSTNTSEVQFLVDNFDIPAHRAAALVVADEPDAAETARQVMAQEQAKDPLAEVPVPGSDKDVVHIEPDIADLDKPVSHKDSAPT